MADRGNEKVVVMLDGPVLSLPPEGGWSAAISQPSAAAALRAMQCLGCDVLLAAVATPSEEACVRAAVARAGVPCDGVFVFDQPAALAAWLAKVGPSMLAGSRLRELHAAPGVEDRVWVDVGLPQAGFVLDESLHVARTLRGWLEVWGGALAPGLLDAAEAVDGVRVVPLRRRPSV